MSCIQGYKTDVCVSSAYGAGNTNIGFFKASRRLALKKPMLLMRIAGVPRDRPEFWFVMIGIAEF
jgi:hypothetical protein